MSKFVEAAKTDELKSGTMKRVMAEGREILLARVGDRYCAANDRCPHMKGDLSQGKLERTVVTCPVLSIRSHYPTGGALVKGTTDVQARWCAQDVPHPYGVQCQG